MNTKKLFSFILALVWILVYSGSGLAQVDQPAVGRWFGPPLVSYIDSVSSHRVFTFRVDSVKDQSILKFKLEEDIEIERVSFFSADTISGDTTALYFLEGTLKVDSLILPLAAEYLEFATNFTITKDSSFVLIKLDDAAWGGTAGGAYNAVFTVQYRVKREE
jgi:hypothetical protein